MSDLSANKNLVISNQLVKGRYKLTKEEQNFIYLMISQINQEDNKFKEYRIHISDLENSELTKKNYSQYREFASGLRKKEIIIEDDKQILISGWFSNITYMKDTGIVKATIDDKLKPYLLQLKTQFVKAKMPVLLGFKSKYSSRLYLYLKSVFDFKTSKIKKDEVKEIIEVEQLIQQFKMPETYRKRYSHFKESFLNKAIKEINADTNFKVTYDDSSKARKTGRKITSIEFCMRLKSQEDKSIEQLKQDILAIEAKRDFIPIKASQYVIETLLDDELELSKNDLKHIFSHYKLEDIEEICYELYNSWDNSKLISKVGFLRGKLKQLNRKKTENFEMFGFDEL